MPIQQLSGGGASAPVAARDATSQAAQNGFNFDDYQKITEGLSAPIIPTDRGTPQLTAPPPSNAAPISDISSNGAPTPTASGTMANPSQPININKYTGDPDSPLGIAQFIGGYPGYDPAGTIQGNPYSWDPFSAGGAGEFAQIPKETESQGYKDFGNTWLDLINTVSNQNLQWGGTNQFGSELKGGGSVGPWLSQNIVSPWSGGDQKQAYNNALYFISSQTGKPPTDPYTQQMAGAFLEYTLQNDSRYSANTQNFDQRRAAEGGDKGIFGPLLSIGKTALAIWQPELAPLIAAESFAEAASQGNTLGMFTSGLSALGGGLSNLGDIGTGWADIAGLAGDAGTLSDLSQIGGILSLGSDVAGGVGSLASGDLFGAAGAGIGSLLKADNLFSSTSSGAGTGGSNATSSGGVMSGLANSLGISPSDLGKYLDYAQGAGKLAMTGIPIVDRLTQDDLQIPASMQQAATPPPAPAAGPAFEAKPAGQALARQDVYNPSQSGYRAPGPRQANPTMDREMAARLLQALGMPA